MKRICSGTLLACSCLLLWLLAFQKPAFACACCTNEGQRTVATRAIGSYEAEMLDRMRFAADARLYTGEADAADVEYLGATSNDFRLAVTKHPNAWTLALSQSGNVLTLRFDIPKDMTAFEVDPRDPAGAANGTGPTLYKEWRLASHVRAPRKLTDAAGALQPATLIFHGRGNSCTDYSDFTAWTLVLHGRKAGVTFIGGLGSQAKDQENTR